MTKELWTAKRRQLLEKVSANKYPSHWYRRYWEPQVKWALCRGYIVWSTETDRYLITPAGVERLARGRKGKK